MRLIAARCWATLLKWRSIAAILTVAFSTVASFADESNEAPAPPPGRADGPAAKRRDDAGPFATTFDDPLPHAAEMIDAAEFNGVKPGTTMSDELEKLWGEGKEIGRDGERVVLAYSLDEFPRVDVTLAKNRVTSVVVHLEQPIPPAALAERLEIDDVRSVNVPADSGAILGQMFPEHGVLLNFTPDGKRVLHVVLEEIDLESFVLRAEMALETHCRGSLADLDYVLGQQPNHTRALWLRAKLLSGAARYDEALKAVEAALAVEPKNPEFLLSRAEIFGATGKYDEAAEQIKKVLAAADLSGELKAKALCQLGDLLAASPAHDYQQAMEHHMSAIQTADPLSIDERVAVRRAAKLVLIDAHLAVANDIACGNWQQKKRVAPKWLARAGAYADDMIDTEDGDPALRLRVARGALAACAGAKGKIDPVPWTRMALQKGKELIAGADDPWRKSRLEWVLGLALSDGLTADDFRGAHQHALANSTLTATYLETAAQNRRETPGDVFRLGRLYYRVGSLHAVKRNDHKTAVAWYEKAFPLLDRPLPATQRAEQGRYGEWLVSMGISYWETGRREEAVHLTETGVQNVEEAVERQLLDHGALAVPYGNLAAMHEALGHQDEARNFAELASKSEGETRR